MKPMRHLLEDPHMPSIRTIGFCAQRFRNYSNSEPDLHQHDVVELFFVLGGHGIHIGPEGEEPLAPGDSGIVDFGQSHSIVTIDEPMDIVNLYIDPSRCALPPLAHPLGTCLPRILPLARGLGNNLTRVRQFRMDRPEIISQIFLAMTEEVMGYLPGHLEAMRSYLRLLLLEYARFAYRHFGAEAEPPSGSKLAVDRTRRYLDDNWSESINLDVLSRKAGLSRAHLCRIFKKHTGRTIVEYVHQRRIEQAMIMLGSSSAKIITISHSVGFNDLAHFNRIFKRFTGLTPSEFRKKQLGSRHQPEASPPPREQRTVTPDMQVALAQAS